MGPPPRRLAGEGSTPRFAGKSIAEGGGRNSRRPGGFPPAEKMPDSGAVVAAAVKEAELAKALRDEATRSRETAREKQLEMEEDVTREVRERIEESSYDLSDLSSRLSAVLRRIGDLEKMQMELEMTAKRKEAFIKNRAPSVKAFRDSSDNTKVDVNGMLDAEEAALREALRQVVVKNRETQREIFELYRMKEAIEIEIEEKRRELAIDQELLRARASIENSANRDRLGRQGSGLPKDGSTAWFG